MQPGAVQSLADIDVAQAGNQPLVEERAFEWGDPVAEKRSDRLRGQAVAERLDPHPGEMPAGREAIRGDEVHEAEAARVVIGHRGAVRHRHDDVVVLRCAQRPVEVEIPRRQVGAVRHRHIEAPAHPEMHDQGLAGIEPGGEVLGPPCQIDDGCSREALGEALREGEAQVRAPQDHAGETGADHGGTKPAADGFDFGQFGHEAPSRTASFG